jgi:hypothetical protein
MRKPGLIDASCRLARDDKVAAFDERLLVNRLCGENARITKPLFDRPQNIQRSYSPYAVQTSAEASLEQFNAHTRPSAG